MLIIHAILCKWRFLAKISKEDKIYFVHAKILFEYATNCFTGQLTDNWWVHSMFKNLDIPENQITILLVLKFQTAAVTPATTTHQNAYEKVVYNAATSFLTQQAQSTKPTWQKSEKPTFKLSGQGGKSWNNRNTGPPKVQQLHYCEVCKISCAGPQVCKSGAGFSVGLKSPKFLFFFV